MSQSRLATNLTPTGFVPPEKCLHDSKKAEKVQ